MARAAGRLAPPPAPVPALVGATASGFTALRGEADPFPAGDPFPDDPFAADDPFAVDDPFLDDPFGDGDGHGNGHGHGPRGDDA